MGGSNKEANLIELIRNGDLHAASKLLAKNVVSVKKSSKSEPSKFMFNFYFMNSYRNKLTLSTQRTEITKC